MSSTLPSVEYYVTLHDAAFMPIGLNLYRSLLQHQSAAHLTVVCMDTESYGVYQKLRLPNLTAVSPDEWLDERLFAIRESRNRREFCWTMASLSYNIAWHRHPTAQRMTYLDADLYFFASPVPLIAEMLEAGKQILITEHSFDPKYDQTGTSGIYCVQFVTFSRSSESERVLRDWQDLCVENCSEQQDGRTFGDQMYLDTWPKDYPTVVHVSELSDRLLAPWNVDYYTQGKLADPIFFHFHSLRIVAADRVLAWEKYRIGDSGRKLYAVYLTQLGESIQLLRSVGYSAIPLPPGGSLRLRTSTAIRRFFNLQGQRTYMTFPAEIK